MTTGRPCHVLEILGRAGSTPARQGCGENACACGAHVRSRLEKRYLSQMATIEALCMRGLGHISVFLCGLDGSWMFLVQTWASRS